MEREWPLAVRRAVAADHETVLGFATNTWDGWDYIPNAWPRWIDAPDGVLLVGCAGVAGGPATRDADGAELPAGRPIAISRVALLSSSEAWVEGIRVDPRVRGMNVATDLQVAELHWAAASGVTVVRYATSESNEASHRLGGRHGFVTIAELSSWNWHEQPPADADDHADDDSQSGFDEPTRASAAGARQRLLAQLAADGMTAAAEDGDAWWARLRQDSTFNALHRLNEQRGWTEQELSRPLFDAMLGRGEVIVLGGDADGWALALLVGDIQPAEDADLHLSLLCGSPAAAVALADGIRQRAAVPLRFRLPAGAPLNDDHAAAFAAVGFYPRPWKLHVLARPLDGDNPPPPIGKGLELVTTPERLVPALAPSR